MNSVLILGEPLEVGYCGGCDREVTLVLTPDGLEAEVTCECGSYMTLVA